MFRSGGTPRGSRGHRIAAGLALPIAVATALGGAAVFAATAQAAPPPKNGKVTLCHATPPASAKNGWVRITVSTNAVTHAGHGQHADDIIPAFTYYDKRATERYPGKNLGTVFFGSTGAQILADGCRLPARPTSEPPATSSAPPSTSAPASTSSAPESPAPVVTRTVPVTTEPAPTLAPSTVTVTSTSVAGEPAVTLPSSVPAPSDAGVSGSAAVEGVSASRGAAPAVAVHAGLAAGDTGDSGGSGSSVGLTAAILGGAVAGLIGLIGLAYWRRRRGLTDGSGAAL